MIITAERPLCATSATNDSRFTFGVVHDVAAVLAEHGYQKLRGSESVDLQQALFLFLYVDTEVGTRPPGTRFDRQEGVTG